MAIRQRTTAYNGALDIWKGGTNEIHADNNGQLQANTYLTPIKATAALTAGQVVKVDTAHANQIVVAGTGDGAGIDIGFVTNSPAASSTALVATMGQITTPVMRTGTCAIRKLSDRRYDHAGSGKVYSYLHSRQSAGRGANGSRYRWWPCERVNRFEIKQMQASSRFGTVTV
jgi:hypothetical protein